MNKIPEKKYYLINKYIKLFDYSLLQFPSIICQCKNVIRENNDFVIPFFMITNQKFTGTKLVWIHHI